ncbi:MAG: nucleoside 2-deoxyribosyltransferase [Alphaproteobacteria bacterium]|nr:nucleoside 2-deoxyribosyltransferase [Alphaproteobacteria bacterium]
MSLAAASQPERPAVYLAGPMVFEPDPAALFAAMKAICAEHGLVGVAPLDDQAGLEGAPPGRALVTAIVRADCALMRRLDAGLFCLDGFRRGPEMDPGTAFEIGFMCALGKPLAGWTRDPRPYPERVAAFFRDTFSLDLHPTEPGPRGGTSGALRDPDGILVHSEGCLQNAMTEIGIELGGGRVFADPDWRVAFGCAAANLAERLRRQAFEPRPAAREAREQREATALRTNLRKRKQQAQQRAGSSNPADRN